MLALLVVGLVLTLGVGLAGAASGDLSYGGCITAKTQSGPTPGTRACDAIAQATSSGTSSGLDTPADVAVSPDGSSLYIASAQDDAVARFTRNTATGDVSYKGCITGDTASGPTGTGACAQIASATLGGAESGLDTLQAIVLSPNGSSLYVSAGNDDAVARFARNKTTGALTYKGCITGEAESGPSGTGACAAIPSAAAGGVNSGLDGTRALAVTGGSLYVAAFASDSVARFTRNTTSGALTYNHCITGDTASGPTGSGACSQIPSATPGGVSSGLDIDTSLTLSADHKSLYVGAQNDDAVARFTRNTTTGALTYNNCITGETETGPSGSGACTAIPKAASSGLSSGLDLPFSLATSPDGTSLYASAANDDSLARFARNTTTGALTYKNCRTGNTAVGPSGTGACLAIPTAQGAGANSGLDSPRIAVVSGNGASVYVDSSADDAVARFARNTTTGAVAFAGCLTGKAQAGPSGTGACAAIPSAQSSGTNSGLDFPGGMALSPDSKSLYIGTTNDDSLALFSVAP